MPERYMTRICVLSDLVVNVAPWEGWDVETYRVDPEGCETGDPINTQKNPNNMAYRVYHCLNCGWQTDGADTFDIARQHLGKLNMFIQPFGPEV